MLVDISALEQWVLYAWTALGQKEKGAAVLCPSDVRVHQRLHRIDTL